MVAEAGLEPTTFGLWARRATKLLHPAIDFNNYKDLKELSKLFIKLLEKTIIIDKSPVLALNNWKR